MDAMKKFTAVLLVLLVIGSGVAAAWTTKHRVRAHDGDLVRVVLDHDTDVDDLCIEFRDRGAKRPVLRVEVRPCPGPKLPPSAACNTVNEVSPGVYQASVRGCATLSGN